MLGAFGEPAAGCLATGFVGESATPIVGGLCVADPSLGGIDWVVGECGVADCTESVGDPEASFWAFPFAFGFCDGV